RRPGGPPDRYRNDQGQIVDRTTGQVLHDQNSDRTLLSTRAHNRLVRLRGYRILHRGGKAAHGATVGLPANIRRARQSGSRYAQDARQQVQVWANTGREDARAWGDTRRHVSRVIRRNSATSNGSSTNHPTPPTRTSPAPTRPSFPPRPTTPPRPTAPPRPTTPPRPTAPPPRLGSPTPTPRSNPGGAVLPGGGSARSQTRDEARARMQELMRRTAPDAERLRRERARRRNEDGEDE
ncbi:hypothetical protein R6V09_14180, partial [Streptomyces sp. W16]|nr:hypothetical protein [Streptomyces sp. W16]